MSRISVIFRREFASYFATPLAGVFLVLFLFLSGLFTFNLGGLFDRGQADLRPFFQFLPWLLLFLVPAISMRLWAEERRIGTIELLTTLPFTLTDLVLGKFLAAWAFAAVAILLSTPMWITVAWLGSPDHGVIIASYCGGLLMAGSFLAVGGCISATTKNQVIAFVVCVVACFLLLITGFPAVQDYVSGWAPSAVVESLAAVSALSHFESILRGVLDVRDVLYFASVIAASLFANVLIIQWRKAD
ncbi:MAG: ABC transporter permease [Planctomycetota bacterium]|nr:ABC transporter permease [Planctomycetota bacterium]